MQQTKESADAREAVALFKREEDLVAAIDNLLSSGFDRAELSLLATEDALEERFGDRFRTAAELEDAVEVPRCCYVSPESIGDAEGGIIGGLLYVGGVAAIGVVFLSGAGLAAAIAAAVLSGGAAAAAGTLFARKVGKVHAAHIREHLQHGGLLLWLRTWTAEDEKRAIPILLKHFGQDVHIHGRKPPADRKEKQSAS